MNGLLLQPGRDEEGLRSPDSQRVTGWAAISFSSRAASSSTVSPSSTRLPAFRMRLGCVFLTNLIKVSLDVENWMYVFAYFLIRCRAFGPRTGVKAAASLSAASLAKRSSRKCAVFDAIASYSCSCSNLKLAFRFIDWFNTASASRRAAEEFLLISALPAPLRHRFNG